MIKHLLFLAFFLPGVEAPQNQKEITWADLIPAEVAFEDPFLDLEESQLYNLKYIYRLRVLAQEKPEAVTPKLQHKLDSLENDLTQSGIDVDYLLSLKDEIRNKRQLKAESVVPQLDGQNVRMAGFLLPLELSDKASTEFLLVPYVGACIHEPTPSKNQIIYINYPEGYPVQGRYLPVWVTGKLIVTSRENTLNLVDGSDDISSGYAIEISQITPYKSE